MPRSGRAAKDKEKLLKDASSKKGQTHIVDFFSASTSRCYKVGNDADVVQENKNNSIPVFSGFSTAGEEGAATSSNDNEASASSSLPTDSEAIAVPKLSSEWVKCSSDFTKQDKIDSENEINKGRYCRKEWFQEYEWVWYNRERKSVFYGICTEANLSGNTSPFFVFFVFVERFSKLEKCC